MLVINYKGNTPQQRFYNFGVQGNDKSNEISFVVGRHQPSVDLLGFACNLKLVAKDSEYRDYISLDGTYDENSDTISFDWLITLKSTEYRYLDMQLEFVGDDGNVIWQTLIVGLELGDSILVDKKAVAEKDIEIIDELNAKVGDLDERVDELERELPKTNEIIIGDPNDYLNENGLDKIIRQADENGDIDNAYLINKVVHESTYAEMNFNEIDENGDIIGVDCAFGDFSGFTDVFGDNAVVDESDNDTTLYYNKNGIITKGIKFGTDDFENYSSLNISNCVQNKDIRIVVGKYFEYDENGNKVFDEHSAIYIVDKTRDGIPFEITEEKQTFVLQANDSGSLYFDSDSSNLQYGNTRFILYEINTGEHESIEYNKSKIIESEDVVDDLNSTDATKVLSAKQGHEILVKTMPCFAPNTTLKDIYRYYIEHQSDFDTSSYITFMVQENDMTFAYWLTIDFSDLNEITIYGLSNVGGKVANHYFHYESYKNHSIANLIDNFVVKDIITGTTLTQDEYDNLDYKDSNTYYFIIEE